MVQSTSVGSSVSLKKPLELLRAHHKTCTPRSKRLPTVSLPDLIAQTNMDQQSVNRLREELAKITNWLSRNATRYFVPEYETPSQAYIELARTL